MTTDPGSPRLLITSGEPAGIGPDIIVKLLQDHPKLDHLTFMIDPALLQDRAKQMGIDIHLPPVIDTTEQEINGPAILPVKLKVPVTTGKPDPANAEYLLEMLERACKLCLNNQYAAMVTGPLQKSIINDAGIQFSGHTEYLAAICGDEYLPVMLLACPGLRVALVTTHLPLRNVADVITAERLQRVITIVDKDLRERFGIKKPRIIVCGLNPHAGEDGHLGTEELTIIKPVIENLKQQGLSINGPLPADTAFRAELREQADVYIAMYHDQGLPVLKTLGFGEAVNVTLGLPIIRTSVDHGTALTLAGTGKADCASFSAAIDMATLLTNGKYIN